MPPSARSWGNRFYWLFLAVLLLALYGVLPQLGSFRSSWQLLRHPSLGWTLVGLAAIGLTYLAAAATYCFLAFKPLAYGRTLVVQLGAMFINRLLPAGLGGLGANYLYLRHQNHSPAQATTAVAVNNSLGIIGHGLLLAAAVVLLPQNRNGFHWSVPLHWWLLAILGALTIAAFTLIGTDRLAKFLTDLRAQFADYGHRPADLLRALASSMILTTANVAGFGACCRALDVHLSPASLLIVFTLGAGAGSAIPTPGGLGSFEAGLTAGLIASQIPAPTALAIALLYRLISYWLPLLPGGVALLFCQRHGLFGR